eukprot:Seg600.5 transcript_id=Seg600.5/GoldUCD/mRNA.D3Y31 product="hypothetical protein" protein_id=Seg600.5/GoldUCD/D3Y31
MSDEENAVNATELPTENGDEPPSKKAKGHPKKATAPDGEELGDPPKRSRGRPRKYPPVEKKAPSGRPRGRPKGSGGSTKAPEDVPLASEKAKNSRKPRGRPPKSAKAK